MIASSAFLLYALYLTFQTGLDSLYGKCIILSQALAWVGDFFMTYSPIKNKNQLVYGIVGGLAFLFAHGVYLYSFFLIQKRIDLFPKGLFWIIFAITVGGSIAGIIGMFLGVPVVAFLSYLFDRYLNHRLRKKNISDAVVESALKNMELDD